MKKNVFCTLLSFLFFVPLCSVAADGESIASGNWVAITFFVAVIIASVSITFWAAKRNTSAHDFYTAGGTVTGTQNGLAICGDFMSASTLLGVIGLAFVGNPESIIYIVSPILGLAFLMLYVAEPLRSLGKFTLVDVMTYRFPGTRMRLLCSLSVLTVTIFYLIAQMVGAGALLEVLLGIPYWIAVIVVALLMMLYVVLGGMLATTWVQIIKAVLLIVAVSVLSFLTFSHFGFDAESLYAESKETLLANVDSGASSAINSPFSALSLGVAMSLGMAGLPHLLIRFFTVPDGEQARKSVMIALYVISAVFLLVGFVLAYGSIALVCQSPESFDSDGSLIGGTNMAVIHLARVLGGEAMLGFIAAVTFATILAVVAGLTMAGAGALANDIYVKVLRKGDVGNSGQILAFRIATLFITVIAVLLGIAFEGQSIAYMVGLAFTVAASANFPILILALY